MPTRCRRRSSGGRSSSPTPTPATCRSPSTTARGRSPRPSAVSPGRCSMPPSRPDILAARGTARPLQRLDSHLRGEAAEASPLREVAIAELWLRHQPRKLVPDALIAEDRAQPATLLDELQRLAADESSVYAETLRGLHELAATIRVHGVLVPIRLARIDERYVVEEGHRRSLAALLAGLDRLPAVLATSASDLLLAARQFVANDQRADLSALEKASWLRELVAKADLELRARSGLPLGEPSFAALFEGAEDDDGTAADDSLGASNGPALASPAGGPPAERRMGLAEAANGDGPRPSPPADERQRWERHKGEVRAQVLSLTGLSLPRYYQLRQLNRLCPEARELGAGL